MYRQFLRPRWVVVHALTMLVVLACLALGWWQLRVYQDNQARHDTRALAPVPIADLLDDASSPGHWQDRQVLVRGEYLAERQVLVPGRVHANRLGLYVVTPVRTEDGRLVAVVRGWIDDADDPGVDAPAGSVELTGYLQPPETPDHATVRSGRPLPAGQVPYVAPEQIGLDSPAGAPVFPGYLLLQNQEPHREAAPVTLDIETVAPIRHVGPWQNLSYWAQWWVFAVAAVAFWVSAVRAAMRRSGPGDVTEPARTRVPS